MHRWNPARAARLACFALLLAAGCGGSPDADFGAGTDASSDPDAEPTGDGAANDDATLDGADGGDEPDGQDASVDADAGPDGDDASDADADADAEDALDADADADADARPDSGCPTGFEDCDDDPSNGCETDLRSSMSRCGACHVACAPAHGDGTCDQGVCKLTGCSSPWADCDGLAATGCEARLDDDPAHCGNCGRVCVGTHGTATCTAGSCGIACSAGWENCNGDLADGCESWLSSPQSCGACGNTCAYANATPTCAGGTTCLMGACATGWGNCNGTSADGCETNLLASAANCGACGQACTFTGGTGSCTNGSCTLTACVGTARDCDGKQANGCEVDIASDPTHCGSCATACTLPHASSGCAGGACTIAACASGWGDCNGNAADGCEANLNDPARCGSCGHDCHASGCTNGACTGTCATNWANCDNVLANGCEVNLQTDAANCGACGHSCGGAPCVAGACSCSPTTDGASCAAATSLGTAWLGATLTRSSALVPAGREAWYQVHFASTNSYPTHPRIQLTTNPNDEFVFDVYFSCSLNTGTCPEGGTTVGRTDWETFLAPGAGSIESAGFIFPSVPADVWIRVTRKVAATSCNAFTLTITNLNACDPRLTDCDSEPGCETNTHASASHCGGCGMACSTNHIYAACLGGCVGTCESGWGDCNGNKRTDGCETFTSGDPKNCGACGKVCSTNHVTQSCGSGVCNGTCSAGWGDCNSNKQSDGCEAPLNTTTNCGSCGNACATGKSCISGTCQ